MTNKDLTGALFPYTKTNEKQPDYKGKVQISGVEYEIAAWNRTSKNDLPYMSIKLQKKGDYKKKEIKNYDEEVKQVAETLGGQIVDEVPF